MRDNKTPFLTQEYDTKIESTIPHYSFFHDETIDLIKTVNSSPETWLDTGCGTGRLIDKASKYFINTRFTLADPAEAMLMLAKARFSNDEFSKLEYLQVTTQDIDCPKERFDVITAIQCHHYLDFGTRKTATENCFRLLKENGIYITFENTKPSTETGLQVALQRWRQFQLTQGKSEDEVINHLKRFDVEYFPISAVAHINLLYDVGFSVAEIFWISTMQAGFYAIK